MAIGQDITILAGGNIVAKARACSYTEPTNMVDVSGSDDGWDEHEAGSQGWSMSIQKLWTPAEAAYAALRVAKAAGSEITARWRTATGRGRSGDALVAEMSEEWDRNAPVLSRIELQGNGAVTDDPTYGS